MPTRGKRKQSRYIDVTEEYLRDLAELEKQQGSGDDPGFVRNMGKLAYQGAERLVTDLPLGLSVARGEFSEADAGRFERALTREQYRPQELAEAEERLSTVGDDWDEAEGFGEKAAALGKMLWSIGKEAATNPKGMAYFTADQAANMVPPIAGMLVGAKLGALTGPGAPVAVPSMAYSGAVTGGMIPEMVLEVSGFVGKELESRGLAPTEQNIYDLISDPGISAEIISKARKKALGTASVDAAFTLAGGKIAGRPMARALREAERTASQAVRPSVASRIGHGLAGGATDVAGEMGSEATGQLWATGEVDMGEVALEGFGGLGGATVEVPAAARALAADQRAAAKRREIEAGLRKTIERLPEDKGKELAKTVLGKKTDGAVTPEDVPAFEPEESQTTPEGVIGQGEPRPDSVSALREDMQARISTSPDPKAAALETFRSYANGGMTLAQAFERKKELVQIMPELEDDLNRIIIEAEGAKMFAPAPPVDGAQFLSAEPQAATRETASTEKEAFPPDSELYDLNTQADIDRLFEFKSKQFGSKRKYLESDEYRQAYPVIQVIHSLEKENKNRALIEAGKDALREAGQEHGHRVELEQDGEKIRGRLVFTGRKPPYVAVEMAKTLGLPKTMPWHTGWNKIDMSHRFSDLKDAGIDRDEADFILDDMVTSLQQGEGGGIKGVDTATGEFIAGASTYPEWFRGLSRSYKKRGARLTAREVISTIHRVRTDKLLEDKQEGIFSDILQAIKRETGANGMYADALGEYRRITKGEVDEIAAVVEGVDGGEISEIEERLVEDFQEAIGEEGLTPEQEETALAELTSFFENVNQAADHVADANKVIAPAKKAPKGEFKTAELEGFSEAETFSLINPETEISPKLPEQVTPKNEELFGKDKPQYSIEEEAKTFSKQLDDYAAEKLRPRSIVTVGRTPYVLERLGAEQLPLVITKETVDKVVAGKHGLSIETLKELPGHLADPIMVFDSATQPDSLVVMTELKQDGKTVVAAIHLSKEQGRNVVNDIASVYGKDSDGIFVKWIADGLLRYMNKKKSRAWSVTSGLQLPTVRGSKPGFKNKILFDYDLVKPEYSTADQPGTVAMPSLTDVQAAFKGQGVTQLDDGSFAVKTRGEQDLIIRSVDRIDADSYALNIGYGRNALSRGKVVVGKYHQGTIELTRGAADNVTLVHESIHFMEDIGVLNSLDVAALRGHIKRLVREGKFETQNKEDIGGAEDRATFIAAALTSPPKGAIGRIISRIQDFIDKIVNAFGIRTVGGVIRDIKTGEVFGSKIDNQAEWTYSYIHGESANNISDGGRETLRDNSGGRAGVQYRPTVVGREKIGGLKVSGRIIHKPQDAAQIAAQYLKKYPDEHLISLVMDKEGKLLHVYRHTVGLPGSSMASAPIIAGEALNTPGAARVIVAHNHPSQSAVFSTEDKTFSKSLSSVLKGSGVELTDSLAVTTDKYSSYAETEGTSPASLSEETTGKINIPLLGRVFEVIHNGPKVNNAEGAKSHAEALIPDGGVLVMDGQNAIAGTVDISDFSKIRGRVQAELLKAFEKRNGRAMIVYSPNRAIKSAEANNLAKFLGAGQNEVKLLDIIDTAGSWADKGTMPQSSWGNVEFYSYQIPSAEQGRQESMIVDWERKGEGRSQGNPNPTSPASTSPGSRQGTFRDKDITSDGKVNPEKYSIRRQQDPPVSRDPKILNTYLKDETDAIVQTIMNKLRPKHMTYLETMLKSPEWFGNPQISNIVRLFVRDRNERYHETFNALNMADDIDATESTITEAGKALKGKGLSLVDRLAGKESAEYKMLSDFIDYFDTEAKRDPNKSDAENLADCEAYMRKNGATDDVVRVWRLYRQSYDEALALQTRQLRDMIAQIIEEAAFRGESPDASLAELKETLKYALAEMETWKGYYAPRIREAGNWKVQAYKKHGPLEVNREYYRDHRGSELSARRLANKLRRDGWTVSSVSQVEKLPEAIYQDVKAAAAAKLIDNALDKVKENSTAIAAINSEVLRAVADEIRARGFRSHMIRRKEGAVIKGYIEDPIRRHLLYTNQLAGGLSKAYVARRAIEELLGQKVNGKHVGGIDPIADPKAYEVATNYIEEQLRNLDASDRIIGLAKSIATFKFLGFNIRSLAVNMTAIVTTAPPAIHQYAMGGKGSIAKVLKELGRAGGDYGAFMAGRKLANADEQTFLEDLQRKGWDDAQYTRDALGVMEKTHSRIWNTMMDGSMYLFGKSEQWNRGTTMLAAYRLARKRGLDYAAAAEAAKEASDRAHGVYGRATLPMWAQGTNPAAKVGQMLYIYSKFSHNYLQMLYDLGFKKKNIKAAMFAFLSPIVVAGGAALPFKDTIFAFSGFILRSLLGEDKDPEKWVWDTIREHLGKTAEYVGRHGVTGAAGIDISGSLSIGVGIPRNMLELTGAIGGVIDAVGEGGKAAMRRQYSKAAENLLPTGLANPIRAAREAKEGVSTRANNPVWGEHGRQLVPTSGETTARVLGFRSTRQAVLSERTWEGKRQAAHYADLRQSIYQRYRAWLLGDRHNQEEHKRIMKMVREYNGKARELKDGEVPEIKAGSLRSQARRMEKAPKAVRANLAN